jgi:hypothetical protein
MGFLKRYPALTAAGISALGAVLGVFIKNPDLVAALLAVAGTFVGLHAIVTPVSVAATQTVQAATTAATEVVKSLDETVVGSVGEVLPAAQQIVTSTVKEVVGALGVKP